jgi:hypothetical protein
MSNSAWSQETSAIPAKQNLYVGIYSNITIEYPSIDVGLIKDTNFYNIQNTGGGNGFSFGGILESYNFKPIILGISLGYFENKININREDDYKPKLNNDPTDLHIIINSGVEKNYYLKSKLLEVSTYLAYNIIDNLNIKAGLYFGFLRTTNLSSTIDTLIEHKLYHIGPRTEGVLSSNGAVFLSYTLGLSYDFSLNNKKTLMITPEILFRNGLNNFENSLNITLHSIGSGLVLKYAI